MANKDLDLSGNRIIADAFVGAVTADSLDITFPTDLTVTASSGALPTADGSITVADATTPTVDELLEFCVELNAKLNALKTALGA